MAHPIRVEATDSHNAKLRRMTRNYGEANPAMNQKLPQEKYKIEGPEPHVGFGASYDAVNARSDKPARRSVAANPVATYKRGGSAKCEGGVAERKRGGRLKHKDSGGAVDAIEQANENQAQSTPSNRARGGRLHHGKGKGATHVNVVVAPQGGGSGAPMAPPPQLAALAAQHPPMPAGPPVR